MNKFIKDFKTFVNEEYTGTAGTIENDIDSLPKEVINTVKKIVDDNFDYALGKSFAGNTITFRVTKTDYDLEQPPVLSADLVSSAEKKRKYDVTLKYVDKNRVRVSSESEMEKGIFGELTYEIDFKDKAKTAKTKKQKEEEFVDEWEKPTEEEEVVQSPEEEEEIRGGRGRKGKGKYILSDIDFRSVNDEF